MILAGEYVNDKPLTSLAIGIFLIALGTVLALDVRGISTALHRHHERPDREQNRARDINWYIIAGRVFAAGGILFLVIGIAHATLRGGRAARPYLHLPQHCPRAVPGAVLDLDFRY
jgi:hypothetical protein